MPDPSCVTCRGTGIVYHTTAIKGDDVDNPCPECGDVEVYAKHPLWAAWDDDDWNGATAANWFRSYVTKGRTIRLQPPATATADLVRRMTVTMEKAGAVVVVNPSPSHEPLRPRSDETPTKEGVKDR